MKWRDYTYDDNGVPVPASYWVPGSYSVYYATPWGDHDSQYIGHALVKTYTKNYIEDPDGKISYGYILEELRRGGKEVIMDPSAFKFGQYTEHKSGDVVCDHSDKLDATGDLFLRIDAKNRYTNDSTSIDQKLEWTHNFTFSGTESTKAYLNIAGDVYGSVYHHHENTWSNGCKIWVHMGVYDKTNKHILKSLNDQISFTLEPGVAYYVYANVCGKGWNDSGDYDYEIHLDHLTHLSLTFVNSEF